MDEYIKRSDAIKRFQEIKDSGVSLKDAAFLDGVMDVLDNVAAADVAPVIYGKWILDRRIAGGAYFKCSSCGRKIEVNRFSKIEDFPYCHCGAKMEE